VAGREAGVVMRWREGGTQAGREDGRESERKREREGARGSEEGGRVRDRTEKTEKTET